MKDKANSFDDEKGLCKQCGHPFDSHALIAEDGSDAFKGMKGIIRCPIVDCPCRHTWDYDPNDLRNKKT